MKTDSKASGFLSELKETSAKAKALKQKIEAIDQQVTALRNMPVSLQDFKPYLAAWAQLKADSFVSSMRLQDVLAKREGSSSPAIVKTSWEELENLKTLPYFSPFSYHSVLSDFRQEDTVGLVCYLFTEQVVDALHASLKDKCAHKWDNKELLEVKERELLISDFIAQREQLQKEFSTVQNELDSIAQEIEQAKG